MLQHAAPVTVLDKFGMTKPMPKNKGVAIKFRRPKPFPAATIPLVEGVTPPSTAFAYEDVSTRLNQFGDVVSHTDVIQDTHEDPVLNDMLLQAGENIGRTSEALNFAVLRAGTSVFYGNGSSRTEVNTPLSKNKLRAVTRFLMAQKAKRIRRILDGSVDHNTTPVESAWVAVGHTDLESDIRELPGFIPTAQYGSRKVVSEHECGTVENIRFVLSPDLPPWEDAGGAHGGAVFSTSGTNADVYPLLVFGKGAYATVPLRGQGAVSPAIISAGQKTKDDPLGQRGYLGWKMWHAAVILNQSWMVRLEVAASSLD